MQLSYKILMLRQKNKTESQNTKMTRIGKMVVIVGPTASGKSALAIELAKKFNGEIVSADSRQVYREMDVGTAKPEVQKTSGISNLKFPISKKTIISVISDGIPHYLIDIKNPNENYTAAKYKRDAVKAINKILKNNKFPILVGGTGLYIKAVIDNLNIPEIAPDPKLRQKLEKEIKKHGLKYLFEKLIKSDPEAAYIVDPNNPRRIIRALEIAIKTEKKFSTQRKAGKQLFDFIGIGIEWPKDILNERINKRVDLMVKKGLIDEIKKLIRKYGQKHQSFEAIGYREIIDYLNKKNTLNEAMNLIKKNTKNYAKRQMTWFKKDKRIYWIENRKEAERLIEKFLYN